MSAARSRQRSAAPCALQKASVVARKDGIARSWLCGRTISAVRGSSCDRKQQGLSCRRSGLGTTSNARRRGRSVGRQGACAGRGCAGGRVGWGGLLRGAHTHARRRTARFASHAVTKVAEGGARSQAEEAQHPRVLPSCQPYSPTPGPGLVGWSPILRTPGLQMLVGWSRTSRTRVTVGHAVTVVTAPSPGTLFFRPSNLKVLYQLGTKDMALQAI